MLKDCLDYRDSVRNKPSKIVILHFTGEVSEWLKEHAWKVCIGQKPIGGSNPPLSAKVKQKPGSSRVFYFRTFSQACLCEKGRK